jgi:hypothetical protein
LWDRLKIAPAEVAVLLNRTSRRLEVQPDLARRVVPVPVLETNVPADFFSLEAAANTGIPASDAASDAVLGPMAGVLGEISALPAKDAAPSRADRARRIAARLAGESGQASVELMGSLGALILLFLFAWQLVLVGTTYVFAGHAARTGARALAVGDGVDAAAKSDLPGPWHDAAVSYTEGQGSGQVDVKVPVPLLVPGLLSLPSIESKANTVIEDQTLPGEVNAFTGFAPFGATAVGGGTAIVGSELLATLHYTTQDHAVIDPATGDALAPINAPLAVKLMIAAANEIHDTSYVWGGGHGGPLSTLYSGYDCSGATSFVLYAAKEWPYGDEAEVSGDMKTYGDTGTGQWVSVYASDGHAFIVIAGLAFDTADWGGPNIPAGTGPRWRTCATCNLSDGASDWTVRHPPGL